MAIFEAYEGLERGGVVVLAVAGFICLAAVWYVLGFVLPGTKSYKGTHILGYFVSMLLSNTIQALGTAMNIRWVVQNGVTQDAYCSAQGRFRLVNGYGSLNISAGGIKQAGNVGNAVWSFLISVHLFNLLFLRFASSKLVFIATLVFGWTFVITMVLIGPAGIENPQAGPYFGITGEWCWITEAYRTEQFFLEYFFEYLSAGSSFVLYTAILLRVRGNLIMKDGKPHLRWVSREDSWKLGFSRDYTDSTMLQLCKKMVWYPVAYSVLIVPIGIARLGEFAGANVPEWATVLTAVIFNLTGLVNVMLLLYTNRLFPETGLPTTTRRQEVRVSIMNARHGVTPFLLHQAPFRQQPPVEERKPEDLSHKPSMPSLDLNGVPRPPPPLPVAVRLPPVSEKELLRLKYSGSG